MGPLAEYARLHGLRPSARGPPSRPTLRQLWRRRHFIIAFATARNIAMYTEAKLGQLWQVLTPLLNVARLLADLRRDPATPSKGIPDFISFLVVGVFVFNFTQRAFISTSTVITDSLQLIRALQFPRASLPLAYVIIELQQMAAVDGRAGRHHPGQAASRSPGTGCWPSRRCCCRRSSTSASGCSSPGSARTVNDFSQLLPFLLRTWMYLSGVLFSVLTLTQSSFGKRHHGLVALLQLNPAALYITLIRNSLLLTQRLSAPGSEPPNARICAEWPGTPKRPALLRQRVLPGGH